MDTKLHNVTMERRLAAIKAKITARRSKGPEAHLRKIQTELFELAQDLQGSIADLKTRRARREQRFDAEDQKIEKFEAELERRKAELDRRKQGQDGRAFQASRVESWMDEIERQTVGEKEVEQHLRRSARKRNRDAMVEADKTSTPANKRLKLLGDESGEVPPSSSKKSVPWLSTRASMVDEDVFEGEEDRQFKDQQDEQNFRGVEEISTSDDDSNLTEEVVLLTSMSMLAAMTAVIPEVMKKTQKAGAPLDWDWDDLDDR